MNEELKKDSLVLEESVKKLCDDFISKHGFYPIIESSVKTYITKLSSHNMIKVDIKLIP